MRIDYIDTAKGIGILIVVYQHIIFALRPNDLIMSRSYIVLTSFHMPLFFILSGYFWSNKSDLKMFFTKKINTLLIPFCCFYLITSYGLGNLAQISGISLSNDECHLGDFIFKESFPNGPIWFLLSLFIAYCYYYIINWFGRKWFLISLLSVTVGTLGYLCFWLNINLPMFLDTSMVGCLFLWIGNAMKKTDLFHKIDALYWLILLLATVTYLGAPHVVMMANYYSGYFLVFIFTSITGTLVIVLLSKKIDSSWLNYYGRYSIIILCTHNVIVATGARVIKNITDVFLIQFLCLFIGVIVIEYFVIILIRNYIPFVVGLNKESKIK